jgi:foldase protein PrsA
MGSLKQYSSRGGQAALLLSAVVLLVLSACGKKDTSKLPLAKIGDEVITLGQFEDKANSMDPSKLPRDIDAQSGKLDLLNAMINKKVMLAKGKQLGYGQDEQTKESLKSLEDYAAVSLMKSDLVKELGEITEDQIQAYYNNLQRVLEISYMLFDHEEEALKARKLVLGQEKWATVAARMKAGDPGPSGNWTASLRYGTVPDDVEKAAFSLSVGQVSEPIENVSGYFLIRLEGERKDTAVPPLEKMRNKVKKSIRDQQITLKTADFVLQVLAKHHFKLNEESLQIVYDALPKDKELVPVPPKAEWPSLEIAPTDMDRVLMSWDEDSWDLRRFYDYYDATSWLGRPRRERRLGGLRRFIKQIAIDRLMPVEARARGYYDRPEVKDQMKERMEEVIVYKIHSDLIVPDVKVTNDDLNQYWEKHKAEYQKPEMHEGSVIVNHDEAAIQAAYKEAMAHGDWEKLVKRHGEPKLMPQGGNTHYGPAGKESTDVLSPLVWQQKNVGEICKPMQLKGGIWGIGRLDAVHPPQEVKLADVTAAVRKKAEDEQAEKIFQQKVGAWRDEMKVQTFPENLAKAHLDVSPATKTEAPATATS